MHFRHARVWPLVVMVLALLFAQLGPEPTRHLPGFAAWGVWALHIGVGLGLAVLATRGVGAAWPRRWSAPPGSTWGRLVVGGLVGSLAFAPFALGFDVAFPPPVAEAPDDLFDHWEARGGPLGLFAEWVQLAPTYLASWLLLNLVPIAPPVLEPRSAEARTPPDVAVGAGPVAEAHDATRPPAPLPGDGPDLAAAFFARLPAAIGRDLVRIDADLHYLQVRTVLGRATVLGTLAEVEAALPALGLRVHRSHWVALSALRRVSKSAKGWACELQGGERVPISRRRLADVRARLGKDFVIDPAG